MIRPVGYLIKTKEGLEGVRGTFYDYTLAENGVFIEAEGPLLAARVPVVHGQIRGLGPLEPKVVLRYGLIPQYMFDLALSAMLADVKLERYLAVVWNDGYHLYVPEQAASKEQLLDGIDDGHGSGGGVVYLNPDKVILDLHSHGTMRSFFSPEDNRDEQGLKLYGVIGRLDKTPQVLLRVGVYGYHHIISWSDVFSGTLSGVTEEPDIEVYLDEQEAEKLFGKEVTSEHELHGDIDGQHICSENRRGWLRWDRWFRR